MGIRVRVEKKVDGSYVILIVDRENESDTRQKFMQVFAAVNRAAALQSGAPDFQARYDEGPLLFEELAIDPDTRKSIQQLGGLQVSSVRLDATVAKLRDLGFDVIQ